MFGWWLTRVQLVPGAPPHLGINAASLDTHPPHPTPGHRTGSNRSAQYFRTSSLAWRHVELHPASPDMLAMRLKDGAMLEKIVNGFEEVTPGRSDAVVE